MKRIALLLTLALAGCEGDEATTPTAERCDDVPTVSWDTFGHGFLTAYCQGCHADTAENRHGAPTSVAFGTPEDAVTHKDRIRARATGESPDMPPAGGPNAAELERLEIWLTCFDAR